MRDISVLVSRSWRPGALTAMSAGFIARVMRVLFSRRPAGCLHDLRGGARLRHRRRRSLRFDRLLRLRPRCFAFVCSPCQPRLPWLATVGFRQLLHLSLAHLHPSWPCAITRRCVSSGPFSGFAIAYGLTRLVQRRRLASRSAGCLSARVALAGGLRHAVRHTLLYLPAAVSSDRCSSWSR